eukprot:Plantae.Rhodophyta-Purpureofilum_apyrenoidigerum.ctg10693.p1 GENE.Plantae.Rhodophyta-Purpureofilum_apyrenoidigerum.ctg10693~~Plantae.Rhodophyta-Purpureofilum_apyrenoidigerum.ctg10693.p1  ORF type:complete len:208 (-),score=64.34 Plantae.Rhodophyta-Purpureofilum_apyrenoidigerum.ctg10693:873-1496(-)
MAQRNNGRENVRMVKRETRQATRDLNGVQNQLQRAEADLVQKIKAHGKKGDMASARSLTKELIRVREQKAKVTTQLATCKAMEFRAVTANAQSSNMDSLSKAANVMQGINQQMDPKKTMQTAMGYEKESAKLEMMQEMMDDAIDSTFAGADEQADEYLDSVVAEVALEEMQKMGNAPMTKVPQKYASGTGSSSKYDDEIESILARLP